jgi:hypothetical protein
MISDVIQCLEIVRRAEENQREASLVVLDPPHLLQAQRILIELQRDIEIAHAQHGVKVSHFGRLLETFAVLTCGWALGA